MAGIGRGAKSGVAARAQALRRRIGDEGFHRGPPSVREITRRRTQEQTACLSDSFFPAASGSTRLGDHRPASVAKCRDLFRHRPPADRSRSAGKAASVYVLFPRSSWPGSSRRSPIEHDGGLTKAPRAGVHRVTGYLVPLVRRALGPLRPRHRTVPDSATSAWQGSGA